MRRSSPTWALASGPATRLGQGVSVEDATDGDLDFGALKRAGRAREPALESDLEMGQAGEGGKLLDHEAAA